MSSAASSRAGSLRLAVLALAALPALALAQVVAPSGRTPAEGGPADPESPGAAVIRPLESVVPNPRSKGQARTLESGDARFLQWVRKAAQGRVDAARLALNEAAHPCVRKYAGQVAETHVAMIDEIDVLAAARRLTLSTALAADDRKLVAALQKLAGPSFDRSFVGAMRAAQRRDLAQVKRHIGAARDDELAALLRDSTPMLAEQVEIATLLVPMVAAPDSTAAEGMPAAGCSAF